MSEKITKLLATSSSEVVYPLRQRLLQTFLPITLIPLTILGVLGTALLYHQATQQANIKLYERSLFAAELTHRELEEKLALLNSTSINPLTQIAVRTATENAEANGLHRQPIDQVETQFEATKVLTLNEELGPYLRDVAKVGGFAELFMTERHGFNVAYSHITSDMVQRDEEWWQTGKSKGQWIGEPNFDESSQTVTVDLIYAIKDTQTQAFLGILKAGYDVKNLDFLANKLQNLRLEKSEQLQIVRVGPEPQVVLTVTAQGTMTNHDLLVDKAILQAALADLESPDKGFESESSTLRSSSLKRDYRQYNFAPVPKTDWLIVTSASLNEVYAVENQWLFLFGSALLFLGTVSWLVVSRFARQQTAPLSQLADVMQEVIQKSDFTLRMPVTTKDEVGVLAGALNQLLAWTDNYTQSLTLAQQQLEDRTEKLSATLADLRHAQFQLVQNEKMSALGQLVAGIAHEINNPVNFIHGNLKYVGDYTQDLIEMLQLYESHYPNPDAEIQAEAEALEIDFIKTDLFKTLASMKMGTERIREIVLSLRSFSRVDESESKAVDIHEGLESTLLILQHRFKAQPDRPAIIIVRDFGDLPPVECYAGQLNQVFMNILANAIDALEGELKDNAKFEETPKITIRTEKRPDSIVLSIADNGTGIPPAVKERIFDPFFTTKSVDKGTGMGMAISYQLITEKHNGKIECFSDEGVGTEFIIEIPIRLAVPDNGPKQSESAVSKV